MQSLLDAKVTAFQMCLHGFVLSHGQLSLPDSREMYQSVPLETGAVRIGNNTDIVYVT